MKGISRTMAKAGLSQRRIGFDRRANACYVGDRRSGVFSEYYSCPCNYPYTNISNSFRLSLTLCIRGCRSLGAAFAW
jgi:hypothetical protein